MSTLNSPELYLSSLSKNKFFLRRKVGQKECGAEPQVLQGQVL